ncbi:hypothetical protein HY031_01865 [Candidatus Gottesmanbacteria bacterium]|nr:hypothetical protein [Candidatus Gottesmanbacteria bacterium]
MADYIQKIRATVRHQLQKWGFFEYTLAVLAVAILAGIISLYLQSRRAEYVTITVRISNRELQYNDEGAPSPLVTQLFQPGIAGKDALGRVNAEIVDVESFPKPQTTSYGAKETVYVSVKLVASYSGRTATYKYKGDTIELGNWIRIEIGPVVVEGIVYDIDGRFQKTERQTMTVKAQLKTEDPVERSIFSNTTGVDSYIADAIHVGDSMVDSHGQILAKVLEKTAVPASTLTTDSYGNVYNRPNPRKYDVFLTLELHVKKLKGDIFFLDDQPVKVNTRLPLFFSSISIEPRVTEIVSSPQ